MSNTDFIEKAEYLPKGRVFDDFTIGEELEHHWGRTITESDTIQFSTLTLSFNPLYFNRDFATAHGHPDIVVNPQLVFNVALGLSVEDCSEAGGPFLGVFELRYHRPVYPGTTLRAVSTTTDKRLSESNPQNGIVTWHTRGIDRDGELLVDFKRSNLVRRARLETI